MGTFFISTGLIISAKMKLLKYSVTLIITIVWASSGFSQQSYNLNECIQIALENKKTLRSALLDVQSAEKGVVGSKSGYLPMINMTANSGRTQFPELNSVTYDFSDFSSDTTQLNHTNNMSAGFTVNQNIYNGGRTRNTIGQAKSNLDIATLIQRQTKIQVIQNVVKSYYGLLQAQELLDVAENNLELSNQQVSLVKQQFELGAVRKTDLLKAEVAKGQGRVDVLNRKTALNNARRQLFNHMGMMDFGQTINAIADEWLGNIVPTSSEALQLLKTKNPSLLIQNKRIYINELQIKLAKGLRLPLVGASINYSAMGEDSKTLMDSFKDDWKLGMNVSLSVPIYSGNSISIQKQQAQLALQKSNNNYITLLNDLKVQVELIRSSLENYSEIIPINLDVVVSAEEDLKLANERYSLGSASILEVLDAQVSLIRTKSTLINSIHEARIQEMNLKALLGVLDLEYENE